MSSIETKFSKKPVEHNPNKWMLSFADLLSLVLTFFVLIYAMADPIQFTNQHIDTNNSAISFQLGEDKEKIKLKNEVLVDNKYLKNVIQNKIANDEGMELFKTKTSGGNLIISSDISNLTPLSIKALQDTLKATNADIRFVAGTLKDAQLVAYKFTEAGMKNKVSYYEESRLQSMVDIIVYPKF